MSAWLGAARSPTMGGLQHNWSVRHYTSRSAGGQDAPTPQRAPATGEASLPATAFERHVLIVDDEPDLRRMVRAVLEDEGYTVSEASDGVEGLVAIRASSDRLIVLLDYKMPRMNGAELLHAVTADPQLASRHAFIFITANLLAFSPELLQVLTDTGIPVIEKPFSLQLLLDEIERARGRLQSATPGIIS
jgi:CheY-like chemotaxis protein